MESLFNSTGFEIEDRVFVILNDIKYFGTVKKTDERLDRIAVDFSADKEREVMSWFNKGFWEKVTN
jgi:hypothetical protein